MMAAKLTSKHQKLLAEHGLRATYVPSDDIELVDSEIKIAHAASGLPTGYSVQISLYGGYYVNHHRGEGEDLRLRSCGEFRALTIALRHVAKLASEAAGEEGSHALRAAARRHDS